jgi:hypothetical protein
MYISFMIECSTTIGIIALVPWGITSSRGYSDSLSHRGVPNTVYISLSGPPDCRLSFHEWICYTIEHTSTQTPP